MEKTMDMSGISGALTQYTNAIASGNSADELKNRVNGVNKENTSDEELMQVCKDFEAYFMEKVYKEMFETLQGDDYSSKSTSTMVDYYKDEFIKEVASQTVEQGSGANSLAQMLFEQMKRNYESLE